MKAFSVGSRGALIDAGGTYRYWLRRGIESKEKPLYGVVTFIMLNPSTADAVVDDATIRRCMGFAYAWGISNIYVVNLFALRATDPKTLYHHEDPVGPETDAHMIRCAQQSSLTVAAWGTHGTHLGRAAKVKAMLADKKIALKHLGLTKEGHPRHPLYLPSQTHPIPFCV